MTTLAQLADRCQNTLSDAGAGTWSQALVEEWVVDGIRDYSQRFPRTRNYSITFSGSDLGHVFDLTSDLIAVQLVEFPGDQDPPEYCKRKSRTDPDFWTQDGYYDVQALHDQTEYSQLYLSQEPVDGQKLYLSVTCYHDVTLVSGDDLTIPLSHEYIVELFVLWQAFKERLSAEEQDPDTSLAGNVTFLQQLVKGAKQAEEEYRRALKRAEDTRSESAVTGPWAADRHDRIY